MKKLSLLLVFLLISCSGYQTITKEEGSFQFIEEHNLSKDQAYDASLEIMAQNYGSSKEVIQLQNKESGKIIGKGIGKYFYDLLQSVEITYDYTLTITVKDNKAKFVFQTKPGKVQKGDLDKVKNHYLEIKDSILEYYKNYGNDDF